jgi:hypothetical protein
MKTRLFFIPLFASALAFSAFLHTIGAENVRAVQILDLIATGMGLGVTLAHFKLLLDVRSKK